MLKLKVFFFVLFLQFCESAIYSLPFVGNIRNGAECKGTVQVLDFKTGGTCINHGMVFCILVIVLQTQYKVTT
jgi:hypothetical protein